MHNRHAKPSQTGATDHKRINLEAELGIHSLHYIHYITYVHIERIYILSISFIIDRSYLELKI